MLGLMFAIYIVDIPSHVNSYQDAYFSSYGCELYVYIYMCLCIQLFTSEAVIEARYKSDGQWYRAHIVGRKGDAYLIKWAEASWPQLRAGIGGVRGKEIEGEERPDKAAAGSQAFASNDATADLIKDSADLRVLKVEQTDRGVQNCEQVQETGTERSDRQYGFRERSAWTRLKGNTATAMTLRFLCLFLRRESCC